MNTLFAAARTLAGLTRDEVGARAGLSGASVSYAELGRHALTPENQRAVFIALIRALDPGADPVSLRCLPASDLRQCLAGLVAARYAEQAAAVAATL